jgi:predicted acyltransferase
MKPDADRLVSLDTFRGATIAAMILVNNPGDGANVYWPLDHAPWHGWTPTDLVFPFFLFMVGMSLTLSRRQEARPAMARAARLIGLGLFMAGFPYFHLSTLRWPGVLPRIGLCYLAAWAVKRALKVRGQVVLAALLLVGAWFLMTRVSGPEGPPSLDVETNLAAQIDRVVLTGHMWRQTKTWDPEGLLSTLPAIATTVLGLLAGEWLRSRRDGNAKTAGFLGAGLALVGIGLLWDRTFPINKNLWTSSYVLFTGGMAAYLFGLTYWVVDVRGHRGWTRPFVVYGRNAIAVFVGSGLLARLLSLIKWAGPGGKAVSLQERIYEAFFVPWASPINASLAFALATIGFWYLVLLWMDRRGIYLKV